MGSRATALRSRPAVAGVGAAGSLLGAIVAAALMAPGIIGFDDWSLAPGSPLGGSVRVEPGDSAHRASGPVASATSAPVVLPPIAGAGPTAGRGGGGAGRGLTVDGVGSRGGGVSASALPATGRGERPWAGCQCTVPANPLNESLAQGVEGSGATLGSGVDGLGTATGSSLERVSPPLGGEARRGGAAGAERTRQAAGSVGDAIRHAPGPGPEPAAVTAARRVIR